MRFLVLIFSFYFYDQVVAARPVEPKKKALKVEKKDLENKKKTDVYEAIYMRSKLIPNQHLHGPNCEHNQFKLE